MPGARHKILGHVLSGFCHKMNRRKPLYGDSLDTPLNRCLTTFDITLLGKSILGTVVLKFGKRHREQES